MSNSASSPITLDADSPPGHSPSYDDNDHQDAPPSPDNDSVENYPLPEAIPEPQPQPVHPQPLQKTKASTILPYLELNYLIMLVKSFVS